MRKLLLLLFLPLWLTAQVVPPDATPLENIQITNNIQSTTATKATVQENNGVQNYVPFVNIPINVSPVNYSPPTADLQGQFKAIDTRLGQIGNTTAGITNRIFFTGDNVTVTAGTFFASNATGKGVASSGFPTPLVNGDNQKQYFDKDLISIAQPSVLTAPPGVYSGQLTVSSSPTPNGTQQRYTIEIYKTNNGGTPIASGITGTPTGNLGVTVVAILDSGLINLVAGSITNIGVSGTLASTLSLATGERLRYHVSAQKVGTGGGNVTMSVLYGSDYNSYYDVTVSQKTSTVINDSGVSGLTASDALNNLDANALHKTGNETKADILTIANTLNLAGVSLNSTNGYITKNGVPFLHNFYAGANPSGNSGNNLNIGINSGNFNSDNNNYASTMVGFESGKSNKNGYSNTGIGYYALRLNENGHGNTALGTYVLGDMINGDSNTAVGWHASLLRTGGSYNSIFGVETMQANTTGSFNTAFGANAGYNNITGNYNVFLGYAAGLNETGSNKLYVSNSSTNDPLIKGDFSIGELEFNSGLTSKLKIGGSQVTLSSLTTSNTYQNLNLDAFDYRIKFSGNQKAVFNSSGYLGLNNTLANSLLHLKQPANTFTGGLKIEGFSTDNQMNVYYNGSAFVLDATYGSAGAYTPVKIYTSGLERVSFETNGKVKILDLAGATSALLETDTSGNIQRSTSTARPYKVYTALLQQSGTSAPVATVLENTLGGVIVWSYVAVGVYDGTLSSAFVSSKTASFLNIGQVTGTTSAKWGIFPNSTSAMRIITNNNGTATDGILSTATVEIRVYN